MSRVTIHSLDVLLFLFGASLLFHVQFSLLLPDLHTDFQEAGRVIWYSHLFQNFPHFVVIHAIKGFSVVKEAEIYVSLEFSCFIYDPMDVNNLISGSSDFSKSSLNIWKLSVHILLKPSLKDFEHYFVSMWKLCNCVVVRTFFGILLLWDWNENWSFPVLWPLLSFPKLLDIECSTFTALLLRIWSNTAGIPSPPLALFSDAF